MQTQKMYLDNVYQFELSDAQIVEVLEYENQKALLLDKTIFHPQGGGQPSDIGKITGKDFEMEVVKVKEIEGKVLHIGNIKGNASINELVSLSIDKEKRILCTKIHSAAHIIDTAIINCGYNLIPVKGYHFPEGPYVEYIGNAPEDLEKFKQDVELKIKEIIQGNADVKKITLPKNEAIKYTKLAEKFPEGTMVRLITYDGSFYNPCSGTHIEKTSEIGNIIIKKVRKEGSNIRVVYGAS